MVGGPSFFIDFTGHFNASNSIFQAKYQLKLVSQLYRHLKAVGLKLRLYEKQLVNFNVVHHPILTKIKSAFPNAIFFCKKGTSTCMWFKALLTKFNQRFQDFSVIKHKIKLVSTPFLINAQELEESLQLELVEIQCDSSLRSHPYFVIWRIPGFL